MVEDDIRLVLDECNSNFSGFDLPPGIYTLKEFSEALLRNLQYFYEGFNNTVHIESDNKSMKTTLVLKPGTIATMFDEKSIFSTILQFNLHWEYKHFKEYFRQKFMNLSTKEKFHLYCGCFEVSVVNGLRQPIMFRYVLDKPPG